jgi:hypothetical protein
MAEIWKPVAAVPGMLASSEGRVVLPPSHHALHNGGFRTYVPEPTRGFVSKAGKGARHQYMNLPTKRFGNLKVHQLVCEAFHGARPFADAVVIHLDEDALNNRPCNLKWGTQKENMNAEAFKAERSAAYRGKSPSAKNRGQLAETAV